MYQEAWSATFCPLPIGNRNVSDEECLPLVSGSKGCTCPFVKYRMTFTLTKYLENSSSDDRLPGSKGCTCPFVKYRMTFTLTKYLENSSSDDRLPEIS